MKNREIKFRAWNDEDKVMIESDHLAFEYYEPLKDQLASCKYLMQSTGLKDGEGREIFESDIYYDEIEEDHGDRRIFYVITWIKERAAFACLSCDDGEYQSYQQVGIGAIERSFEGFYYELCEESMKKMHYKGNIHQYPELLTPITK